MSDHDRGQKPADAEPADAEPADAHQPAKTTSTLSDVASNLAGAAGPVISAARKPVDQLASGARRIFDARSGARVRRVRRMGRQSLANLWEAHPEARRAAAREVGVLTVPIGEIRGTAVEGAAQRGGDFLPLRDRRGPDWRARWQRILRAVEGLVNLPPVELLKFGDSYWVVDGHNRVAAALYSGQEEIDAVVSELRLPGMPGRRAPTAIAAYLEDSRDLRAAGTGRLTRTASLPDARPSQPAVRQDAPPPGEGQEGTDGGAE